MLFIISLFLFALDASASRPPEKVEVTKLPGLNFKLNFKHYSGYLEASPTRFLHYWFLESQKDPAVAPVAIWFNGGPGCSSMGGLLEELGPFWLRADGATMQMNEWSWNKEANLLVIESPAGVGLSFATDFNVTSSDDSVATENYHALKDFYRIFPAYRNLDLYITGESYAGVYIPTLAAKIVDNQANYSINLKGLAIGNGLVSKNLNTDTFMHLSYKKGFIDENLWTTMVTTCCSGCSNQCEWHKAAQKNKYCQKQIDANQLVIWLGGLNPYDVNRECSNPGALSGWETDGAMVAKLLGIADQVTMNQDGKEVITIDPDKLDHNTTEKLIDLASPCLNETALTNYLNRKDVRSAIGVPGYVPTFEHCNKQVGLHYHKKDFDMSWHIRKVLKNGIRVLLYYGDTDMACNHLLGQRFAKQLGVPETQHKTPWYYNKQIEGFVTRYQGLDYLTVKGVGHMVPAWKPAQAYHMISRFFNNEPY